MIYESLIDALIAQEDFGFGDPWRFSEKTCSIVVPILSKTKKYGARGYYVIEEVKDKVAFTDTGSIGGVKAISNADKPVFIRNGSAFGVPYGGTGTQERSVTVGTVLFPQVQEVLATICVHASRGITPGAGFQYKGLIPQILLGAVALRSQHETWNAVNQYTQSKKASLRAAGGSVALSVNSLEAGDDLVGFQDRIEEIQEFKNSIDDFLKKIPADLEGQIGMAVLDADGVIGLELFDSPESWTAFSKSVAKSYSDVLMQEKKVSDVFEINRDRVVDHVVDFLAGMKRFTQKTIWRRKEHGIEAITHQLDTDDAIGEYTFLGKEIPFPSPGNGVIHLVVTRKSKELQRPAPRIPIARPTSLRAGGTAQQPSPREQQIEPYLTLSEFLRRRGGKKFLQSMKQPQTWTNLASQVEVSSRTLSSLAKAAVELGLTEKQLHQNGKVKYNLTAKGEVLMSESQEE